MNPVWLANGIFLLVYLLLIWERFPKVVVTLLGASLVILLGVIPQQTAFALVDWNVIFLLLGMMIIVNILNKTGIFQSLAIRLAKRFGQSGFRLLVALMLMTGACSALLDNVTTVMFMATITCSLAEKIKINPIPYLIGEVLASNIGGTATLIGDPPNIMIASAAGLTFNDFLIHIAPFIACLLPVSISIVAVLFRKQLAFSAETASQIETLQENGHITNVRLLIISSILLGFVLLGFVSHHWIHQEVGTIALTGASVLMLFEDPKDVWNDVEWDTIFFFIGLFILVGAIASVGTLEVLSQHLLTWTNGQVHTLCLTLLWVSGIASAIIDNIPYTATLIPLIKDLNLPSESAQPLWWALSLGACLGGNGTLIGATANVVAADMAAYRFGKRIGFIQFTVIGSLVTIASLILATAYLNIRYL